MKPLVRSALTLVLYLAATSTSSAAPFMIVGMDEKQSWDDNGQRVLARSGHDLVAIVDLAKPEAPRIVGALPLENSVVGPPVNVAIAPGNRIALVADSVTVVPKGEGLEQVPTNQLFVIDLTRRKPRVVQTLDVGQQPSGLSINNAGTLALVAYRADNGVGVFKIEQDRLREIDRVPLRDAVSHVAFTPDGRRALAIQQPSSKVSVLEIEGHRVTDANLDLPTGKAPYSAEVTPNGQLGLVIGPMDLTIIDVGAQPPTVLGTVPVDPGAEGFAISPRGDIAVSVSLRGSNGNKRAATYHERGSIVVLRIEGTQLTPIKTLEVGRVPEAVGFTPDGRYLYIGNFADQDFWIFRVNGIDVSDTGKRLHLPGHPASARITPAEPGS